MGFFKKKYIPNYIIRKVSPYYRIHKVFPDSRIPGFCNPKCNFFLRKINIFGLYNVKGVSRSENIFQIIESGGINRKKKCIFYK